MLLRTLLLNTTTYRRHYGPTQPLFVFNVLSVQRQTLQLHSTAMGSPVSVVVAEIIMQNIEEQALATYMQTVPLWLRNVDDTFTAIHKDGISDFHEHLNRQNVDILFTKEIEENGKIPFLDCLVTRDNNKLKTTIYRKLKHTDQLLDQSLTTRPLTRLLLSGL